MTDMQIQERVDSVNPFLENKYPVKELPTKKSPEIDAAKEHFARMYDAMPEKMKPDSIRKRKGKDLANNQNFVIFLGNREFQRYKERVASELGGQPIAAEHCYHDVRSGQMVVNCDKEYDSLFESMGFALALLNEDVVRHPSNIAISRALGFPDDSVVEAMQYLKENDIDVAQVNFLKGGRVHFTRGSHGELKSLASPGVLFAQELYQETYSSYVAYIDFCLVNFGKYSASNIDYVRRFVQSDRFKKLAIPESMYLYDVWATAENEPIETFLSDLKDTFSLSSNTDLKYSLGKTQDKEALYASLIAEMHATDAISAAICTGLQYRDKRLARGVIILEQNHEYVTFLQSISALIKSVPAGSQAGVFGQNNVDSLLIASLPNMPPESGLAVLNELTMHVLEYQEPFNMAIQFIDIMIAKLVFQ